MNKQLFICHPMRPAEPKEQRLCAAFTSTVNVSQLVTMRGASKASSLSASGPGIKSLTTTCMNKNLRYKEKGIISLLTSACAVPYLLLSLFGLHHLDNGSFRAVASQPIKARWRHGPK